MLLMIGIPLFRLIIFANGIGVSVQTTYILKNAYSATLQLYLSVFLFQTKRLIAVYANVGGYVRKQVRVLSSNSMSVIATHK